MAVDEVKAIAAFSEYGETIHAPFRLPPLWPMILRCILSPRPTISWARRVLSLPPSKLQRKLGQIVLVGEQKVGKTTIMRQWVAKGTSGTSTKSFDFETKVINVGQPGNQRGVAIQVWDTAVQDPQRALVLPCYRGMQCGIVVFSVINEDSFRQVEFWVRQLQERSLVGGRLPIVVGTHADFHRRQVSQADAERWCRQRDLAYFEINSRNSADVDALLTTAAAVALRYDTLSFLDDLTWGMTDEADAEPTDDVAVSSSVVQPSSPQNNCSTV